MFFQNPSRCYVRGIWVHERKQKLTGLLFSFVSRLDYFNIAIQTTTINATGISRLYDQALTNLILRSDRGRSNY